MRIKDIFVCLSLCWLAAAADMPHLQKQGTATQFVVDGKPLIVLTGEIDGDLIRIVNGLTGNETVAAGSHDTLFDGAAVQTQPQVQPQAR